VKPFVKWLCIAGGAVLGLGLVVFLGSYWAFAGQFAVPATTVDDPALPSRTIGDYRYHFEVFGLPTQPVVIALHGGPGGDYRSLLPLKRLSDDFQLVFYDQRGSGRSPRVADEKLSLEQFVEDLHEVALSVSPHAPVRLIGHSWGAMLAAAYLSEHPDRVSHAVLAEPAFLTAEQGNQWLATTSAGVPPLSWPFVRGAWRAWIESRYVYGPDDAARQDYLAQALMSLDVPNNPLAGYYCDRDPRGAYMPLWRYGAAVAPAIMQKAMNDEGQFSVDLITPKMKRYPHKVLLIAGSCNTIIGPAAQRDNLSLFASAELAIIDDAGHTMFGEKPDESLAVVRQYLEEDHTAIVASE
jgi:proline iminopeptidase